MSRDNHNNTNNSPHQQRMGDLFQQRRQQSHSNHSSRASSRNHHHRGGGGGGGGRRGGGGNRQQQNYSHLPLEQGVVCTLRESFGFIHCADRPDEVFFHYSQVIGMHPADLQMDDEVEFRIGPSQKDPEKLACYQVRLLPAGTHIEWERVVQENVRGLVEKRLNTRDGGRGGGGGNNNNAGSIRVLVEKQQESDGGAADGGGTTPDSSNKETATDSNKAAATPATTAPDGPLVKFRIHDAIEDEPEPEPVQTSRFERPRNPATARPAATRLAKGDLVQFNMVQDRRTQDLYARGIKLLLSEKERLRQEEEKRLLSQATVEQGVITSLKGEYGFLRSNKRREEVYFHYSSIELDEEDHDSYNGGGGDDGGKNAASASASDQGGNGSNTKEYRRSSSTGSQLVLKEGQDMKFLVVTENQDNGTGRRPRISARQVKMEPRGSVKFHDLLATGVVGKVSIVPQPQDSGHALETKGRILLAKPLKEHALGDEEPPVVTEVYLSAKDSPGGSFPYRGGSSVGLWIEVGDSLLFDVVKDFADGACRAVPTRHLVPRENPMDLASDKTGSSDNGDDDENDETAIRLLSLTLASRAEGTVNAVKDMYGFVHFAERPVDAHFKLFQLLPEQLQNDLRRTLGLAHVDDQGRPLKLEVGAEVQFDMSVHGSIQSHSTRPRGRQAGHTHERENLKAQRVLLLPPGTLRQNFVLAKGVRGIVNKDNPKQAYSGTVDLEEACPHTPFEDMHPLVSKMIDEYLESEYDLPLVYHDVQSAKEDDTVIEMIERRGKGKLTHIHIPQSDQRNYAGRLVIQKIKEDQVGQDEAKSGSSGDAADESKSKDDSADDAVAAAASEQGKDIDKEAKADGNAHHRKKKPKTPKFAKIVRFDKSHLCQELKDDLPPGIGDIVECDVMQSRRTGQCHLDNMKIVERKARDISVEESSGFGIVKEVVVARKFGFISVIDEFEMLFFNLASVNAPEGASADSNTPNKKKNVAIRKGDEVKFEIGTEKGGKRVALNVTVLPKGTIPSTAEKNACRGFVLMEPSHTSLKNSPIRPSKSNVSQSSDKPGRWDSFEGEKKQAATSDVPITEQGCILLLEDPSGMFDTQKADSAENKESSSEPTDSGADNEGAKVSSLLQHLRYKTGAIAVHGSGSSSATDDSSRPRRGDMVSFVKSRKGGTGLRDIRIVQRAAASSVRGRLESITLEDGGGVAKFIAATEGEESYDVALSEVVSCDPSTLKEKESVEGILYQGTIYGICRTADLYLESKVAASRKERPKLNLTVRKDRGGTIMAQSMMAKGPDEGTNGFAAGWTSRMSAYVTPFVPDGQVGASADPVLDPPSQTDQTAQPETQN